MNEPGIVHSSSAALRQLFRRVRVISAPPNTYESAMQSHITWNPAMLLFVYLMMDDGRGGYFISDELLLMMIHGIWCPSASSSSTDIGSRMNDDDE